MKPIIKKSVISDARAIVLALELDPEDGAEEEETGADIGRNSGDDSGQ